MQIKGTIHAISMPREFEGVMQIGFVLKENTKQWYNVQDSEEKLKSVLENFVIKGAEILFEYDQETKQVSEIKLLKAPQKGKEGSWSDDMTNFEELLTSAHAKFGKSGFDIKTKMLNIDVSTKTAIFKARVVVFNQAIGNQVFEAHGDALEDNVKGDHIKPHFVRMAETRAIARALRWATNNADVAQEETSEGTLPEEKEGPEDEKTTGKKTTKKGGKNEKSQ